MGWEGKAGCGAGGCDFGALGSSSQAPGQVVGWSRATWPSPGHLRREGWPRGWGWGAGVSKGFMVPGRCPPPRHLRGRASPLVARDRQLRVPSVGAPGRAERAWVLGPAGRARGSRVPAPVRAVAGGVSLDQMAGSGPCRAFGGPDAPGGETWHCGRRGRWGGGPGHFPALRLRSLQVLRLLPRVSSMTVPVGRGHGPPAPGNMGPGRQKGGAGPGRADLCRMNEWINDSMNE